MVLTLSRNHPIPLSGKPRLLTSVWNLWPRAGSISDFWDLAWEKPRWNTACIHKRRKTIEERRRGV